MSVHVISVYDALYLAVAVTSAPGCTQPTTHLHQPPASSAFIPATVSASLEV